MTSRAFFGARSAHFAWRIERHRRIVRRRREQCRSSAAEAHEIEA
jgi:hypothetical protein